MGNLGGLGHFAGGMAGGINQGVQNYANIAIAGMQLEQEKQKSQREEAHKTFLEDMTLVEKFWPLVQKSTDPVATAELAHNLSSRVKTPVIQEILKHGATESIKAKQAIGDTILKIGNLMRAPSPTVFAKVQTEISALKSNPNIGTDHPVVLALEEELKSKAEQHKTEVTPKLRQQAYGAWQTAQRYNAGETVKGGLMQQQPGMPQEDLDKMNSFWPTMKRLLYANPKEYDNMMKAFGFDTKETPKYKVGELVQVKEGTNIVTKQVTGVDSSTGMPVFKDYSKASAKTTIAIEGLTRTSEAKLEDDIMESEKKLMSLNEIESLYDPSFLEYKGQGIAVAQKFADKLGLKTGTEYLQKRAAFVVQSKGTLLLHRKFITGVAGGEKEFAEIARTFPDPDTNSPAQFKANLKQTQKWTKKLINWLKYTRTMGLSITETPEEKAAAEKLMPKRLAPKGQSAGDLSSMSQEELFELLLQQGK